MKRHVADFLICPRCLPEEQGLALETHESLGSEVVDGVLRCPLCQAEYPITEGIAFLLPNGQKSSVTGNARYETPEVASAYLWSHYADLLGDDDATQAYAEWAEQFPAGAGIALDAGCAVGRLAFELSRKCDLIIGIDISRSFIRAARKLLIDLRLDFHLKEEGNLCEKRCIKLPKTWKGERVEFMVADAQALPFRSRVFSRMASLNLLDKLPKPLRHLREMSRGALKVGAQILVSDPFSWSTEYASEEDWLGGRSSGIYAGRGLDTVQAILEGRFGGICPPWAVQSRGSVWWKIRHHRNHFELIRSCYIMAGR